MKGCANTLFIVSRTTKVLVGHEFVMMEEDKISRRFIWQLHGRAAVVYSCPDTASFRDLVYSLCGHWAVRQRAEQLNCRRRCTK